MTTASYTRLHSDQELKRAVYKLLDSIVSPVTVDWVVHDIVSRVLTGDERDYVVTCVYGHVRDRVRRCVRAREKYSEQHEGDAPLLDGFGCIQKSYVVKRNGVQTVVPVDQCKVSELLIKIAELRSAGDGYHKHADQLQRYVKKVHPEAGLHGD